MRILIVYDSRSSLALLAFIVGEISDLEVETFASPIEALLRCTRAQFDLAMVDHVMPEMDGVEMSSPCSCAN
jgi:putative two-component system response regulator